MKKVYIIIGSISLVLGLIGIALPILPTTPFLLFTAFCFAKGSDRFYNWFIKTKIYKNHLDDFVKNKEMTLKTKISILFLASFMLMFPFILVDSIHFKIFIILLLGFKFYYFIFKIKTIKERAK